MILLVWFGCPRGVDGDERAELRALATSAEVSAAVGTRARIVLWHAAGRSKKEIAVLARVSRPTVDLWLARCGADGAAGLLAPKPGGPREQVPADVRSRVLALTRTTPPAETGLSHWSTRTMADYITRTRQDTGLASLGREPVARARRQTAGAGYLQAQQGPRNGAAFLAFLKKAVAPHARREIHVVWDNLSTHTAPDVKAWLAANPNVHFHFARPAPVG